ncbi:hypothetical protein P171DRAFT_430875 [Karstenula rhodostoma CBS 690.94]|uniref:Uncharacterized protein n=1 Tax=Karstenula rhodostoma CBS 690.94 TaxID=1392251 RepID=A0A9P4UCS6_9PLEO|nr:hypothetical protein P171DRAFT_430875 [Karstenula rhodostoma CBS 690.94]
MRVAIFLAVVWFQTVPRQQRIQIARPMCQVTGCLFWMREAAHWAVLERRPAAAGQATDRILRGILGVGEYSYTATLCVSYRVFRRRQLCILLFRDDHFLLPEARLPWRKVVRRGRDGKIEAGRLERKSHG